MNIILIKIEAIIKQQDLPENEKNTLMNVIRRTPNEYLPSILEHFEKGPEKIKKYYQDYLKLETALVGDDINKLQDTLGQLVSAVE